MFMNVYLVPDINWHYSISLFRSFLAMKYYFIESIHSRYLYRGINERYLKSDRTYRIMDELDEYDADVSTTN